MYHFFKFTLYVSLHPDSDICCACVLTSLSGGREMEYRSIWNRTNWAACTNCIVCARRVTCITVKRNEELPTNVHILESKMAVVTTKLQRDWGHFLLLLDLYLISRKCSHNCLHTHHFDYWYMLPCNQWYKWKPAVSHVVTIK